MTPTDPNLAAILSALRSLLILVGGILAAHGLGDSGAYQAIQMIAGSIMVVGPAAWGVWNAIQNYRKSHAKLAFAVRATSDNPGAGEALIAQDKAGTLVAPKAA